MCIPRYKALCLTLTEDLPEFCVLVAFAFTQEFETADAVFLFVITVLLSVLSFVEQVMDYRSVSRSAKYLPTAKQWVKDVVKDLKIE